MFEAVAEPVHPGRLPPDVHSPLGRLGKNQATECVLSEAGRVSLTARRHATQSVTTYIAKKDDQARIRAPFIFHEKPN